MSREKKSTLAGMARDQRFGIDCAGNGRPRAEAGQATSAGGSVEQGAHQGEFDWRLVTSAAGGATD